MNSVNARTILRAIVLSVLLVMATARGDYAGARFHNACAYTVSLWIDGAPTGWYAGAGDTQNFFWQPWQNGSSYAVTFKGNGEEWQANVPACADPAACAFEIVRNVAPPTYTASLCVTNHTAAMARIIFSVLKQLPGGGSSGMELAGEHGYPPVGPGQRVCVTLTDEEMFTLAGSVVLADNSLAETAFTEAVVGSNPVSTNDVVFVVQGGTDAEVLGAGGVATNLTAGGGALVSTNGATGAAVGAATAATIRAGAAQTSVSDSLLKQIRDAAQTNGNRLPTVNTQAQVAAGEAVKGQAGGSFDRVASSIPATAFHAGGGGTDGGSAASVSLATSYTLGPGHSVTIGYNPFALGWVNDLATMFREALAWLSWLALLLYCVHAGAGELGRSGSWRQASSAGTAVLGNNVNSVLALACAGLITVAIVAAAVVAELWLVQRVGNLATLWTEPSSGSVKLAVQWVLNFFPVSVLVGNAVAMLTFRLLLAKAVLVGQTITRFLVG